MKKEKEKKKASLVSHIESLTVNEDGDSNKSMFCPRYFNFPFPFLPSLSISKA